MLAILYTQLTSLVSMLYVFCMGIRAFNSYINVYIYIEH